MTSMSRSNSILTRAAKNAEMEEVGKEVPRATKRSADTSPDDGNKKRPVFCDITNAKVIKENMGGKKAAKIRGNTSSISSSQEESICKSAGVPDLKVKEEPMDTTLYVTALDNHEDLDDTLMRLDFDNLSLKPVPEGVENFDENSKDLYSEGEYAPYVFEYYKYREKFYKIRKYMSHQSEITKSMRAVLIDWMVEVQESFELNHETLYLAVKLVDLYLTLHDVPKSKLQLVGATALLLASKFDERIPPLVDDFLYICDDSYSRPELLAMEVSIMKAVSYNVGIPLSYRFLRRFARCAKVTMETLTLARYILETSLMDYDLVDEYDSKMAAGALYLALRMKNLGDWTATLEYYSGYKAEELEDLVKQLNKNITAPVKNLQTVRTKYSHKIFFEVSKIPPLQFEK